MLLSNLNLLATAPDGVAKLRELILTLAVQGKLLPQHPRDEPASVLLKKIRAEKDRLIAEGKIKRDKPLAEIAEEEKPFDLPVGWSFCQLGDLLLSIRSGGTPSKQNPSYWDGDIPWASVKDLRFGEPISDTQDRITQAGLDAGSELAPVGSILICTRMGLGKIGEALIDVAINQDLKAVLLGAGVDKQYFINYFKTLAVVGSGMTVAGIKQDELLGFVVPLPPAAEQSRIVTRVEELMRLCDALEAKGQLEATQHAQLVSTLLATLTESETPAQLAENWHRIAPHFDLLLDRPEAVDALEQTILQLAVRGHLVPQDPQDEPASVLLKKIRAEKDRLILEGKIKRDKPLPPIAEDEKPFELPQGWEWCQLDELVTIRGGKRVANGYQLSSVPTDFIYVRVSDMKDGSIDDSDLRYLDAQMQSTISRYIITKDDIYMTIVGATIGKCGLVPERFDGMNLTENAARLTPHLLAKDYLFRLLTSEFCQSQFFGKTKQVGVQKMALNRLAATLIPLPPLAEQSRIVARVASLRALCADLRQRLTTARTQQALLAQALVENSV